MKRLKALQTIDHARFGDPVKRKLGQEPFQCKGFYLDPGDVFEATDEEAKFICNPNDPEGEDVWAAVETDEDVTREPHTQPNEG